MTKVFNVETYKSSQGEHIVCKGKLIMVPCTNKVNPLFFKDNQGQFHLDINFNRPVSMWNPIIVSESEESFNPGDLAYHKGLNLISTVESVSEEGDLCFESGDTLFSFDCNKILALSENFSPKQLQTITDNKLKNEDKVFVECKEFINQYNQQGKTNNKYFGVKLVDNYITLFPVELNWEEIKTELYVGDREFDDSIDAVIKLLQDEGYNPPTKKQLFKDIL